VQPEQFYLNGNIVSFVGGIVVLVRGWCSFARATLELAAEPAVTAERPRE
jgi:hypothetical protein